MMLRIGIALAIITVSVGVYALGTHWQAARIGRRKEPSSVLAGLRADIPAVVYFWSETCAPCRTVQSPALKELQAELGPGRVQVVAIDAQAQPQVADEWGVLGLPTTFIIDRARQVRRVNHGVVRADQLRQQIEAVGQWYTQAGRETT